MLEDRCGELLPPIAAEMLLLLRGRSPVRLQVHARVVGRIKGICEYLSTYVCTAKTGGGIGFIPRLFASSRARLMTMRHRWRRTQGVSCYHCYCHGGMLQAVVLLLLRGRAPVHPHIHARTVVRIKGDIEKLVRVRVIYQLTCVREPILPSSSMRAATRAWTYSLSECFILVNHSGCGKYTDGELHSRRSRQLLKSHYL